MFHTIWQNIKRSQIFMSLVRWFDSEAGIEELQKTAKPGVDWPRIVPFIALHVICLGVFWVGWSWTAITVAVILYLVRMFAITGFYHRYFSHKAFKTNRFWQIVFAVLGESAVQRGPLWWAAHHRHHHRFADQKEDVHSPLHHGFLWSHIGWLTSQTNYATRIEYIGDWKKYPELLWLNRFNGLVPLLLAVATFIFGELLEIYAPHLGTNGLQMLIWGFLCPQSYCFTPL
jgi:stearoyl-CoA desaturase (delta-9 desaturase)